MKTRSRCLPLLLLGILSASSGHAEVVCRAPSIAGFERAHSTAKSYLRPTTTSSMHDAEIYISREGSNLYIHSTFQNQGADYPTKIAFEVSRLEHKYPNNLPSLFMNLFFTSRPSAGEIALMEEALKTKITFFVTPGAYDLLRNVDPAFIYYKQLYKADATKPPGLDRFTLPGLDQSTRRRPSQRWSPPIDLGEAERVLAHTIPDPNDRNVLLDSVKRELQRNPRLDFWSTRVGQQVASHTRQLEITRRILDQTFRDPDQRSSRFEDTKRELQANLEAVFWSTHVGQQIASQARKLQLELNAAFGAGLEVDGRYGPQTRASVARVADTIESHRWLPEASKAVEAIVTELKEDLRLAGYETSHEPAFTENDARATKEFQKEHGIVASGALDVTTLQALRAERELAHSYLLAAQPYLFPGRELIEGLQQISGTSVLNAQAKSVIDQRVEDHLQPVRELLTALALPQPKETGPLAWKETLENVQRELELPISGFFDSRTRLSLETLHAQASRTELLELEPDEAWRLIDPPVEVLAALHLSSLPSRNDLSFYRVNPALGEVLRRTFTYEFGDEVASLLPDAGGGAILALADTGGYGLAERASEMIRVDSLGRSLVLGDGSRGLAVFTPVRDNPDGSRMIQFSSNEGSRVQTVARDSRIWDPLFRLLGRQPDTERQARQIEQLIADNAKGHDYILVHQREATDISYEAIGRMPVFRSADPTRSAEAVRSNIEVALSKKAVASSTVVFGGVPLKEAHYENLRSEAGLTGDWPAWREGASTLAKTSTSHRIRQIPSVARGAKGRLLRALAKEDNVVIVVAHSDGETIYFPNRRGEVERLSGDEILQHAEQIQANKPAVLLLSCHTAGANPRAFATTLVKAGASVVIAPEQAISLQEANRILEDVLRPGGLELLLDAAIRTQKFNEDMEGTSRFQFLVEIRNFQSGSSEEVL